MSFILQSNYYQSLKSTSFFLKSLLAITGLILVELLAFGYGVLVFLNPAFFLGFILPVLYGIVFSTGFRALARLFHVREKKFIVALGVLLNLIGIYSSWGVYFLWSIDPELVKAGFMENFFIILEPSNFSESLVSLYHHNYLEIGMIDWKVNGIFLVIAWLLEFVIMFTVPFLLFKKIRITPYSINFNKWYPKYVLYDEYGYVEDLEHFNMLEGQTIVEKIKALGRGGPSRITKVCIYFIENENEQYISFENATRDLSGKGELVDVRIPPVKIETKQALEIIKELHGKKRWFADY
tara:strand:+ start:96 stop:980 length:885 start_codon:yes stop_codon:yes gene_type:complete